VFYPLRRDFVSVPWLLCHETVHSKVAVWSFCRNFLKMIRKRCGHFAVAGVAERVSDVDFLSLPDSPDVCGQSFLRCMFYATRTTFAGGGRLFCIKTLDFRRKIAIFL
jgi:hypothetical protein